VYKKEVIKEDILGRLGHLFITPTRKEKDKDLNINKNKKECQNNVPAVPKDSNQTDAEKSSDIFDSEAMKRMFE
jgi:hypothetical protein